MDLTLFSKTSKKTYAADNDLCLSLGWLGYLGYNPSAVNAILQSSDILAAIEDFAFAKNAELDCKIIQDNGAGGAIFRALQNFLTSYNLYRQSQNQEQIPQRRRNST